jgi:periplasmic protein TonB
MAPIIKENEAAVASPASGNPVNKAAADPSRSQPVALEIPVSVNGARTIEGSDKREPFSESTQTVLVFNNGAVIRLASALASGQLIFLTNDKTKKEVVCQVVKSKNYRTVTGYVELEFTEPAPGFWGMRFPAAAAPAASSIPATPRPAAPAAVAPPQSTPVQQVPATSQTIPSSPAPVAVKPAVSAPAPVPPAPIVTKPLIVPPPAAIVTPEPPKAPAPVFDNVALPPTPISAVPPPAPVHAAPIIKPPVASVPVAPHSTQTAKPEGPQAPAHDYTKQIAAIFSVPQAPVTPPPAPPAPVAPPASVKSEPPPQAATKQPSTDELKLQAARLQEQLSAMLFTETAAKPASPAAPSAPASIAPREIVKPDVTAQKVLELTKLDLAPTPLPPAPVAPAIVPAPIKLPVPPQKSFSTLDKEEVQIPSWLAPLARNSELPALESSAAKSESAPVVDAPSTSDSASSESSSSFTENSSQHDQPAMFGGQLLSDSSTESASSSSGSKKGLFLGLAAAIVALAAGGFWYSQQPGNALSGLRGSQAPKAAASSQPTNFAPASSSSPLSVPPETNAPVISAKTVAPSPAPASSQPANTTSTTSSVPAPSSTKSLKEIPIAAVPTPAVAQPKKPALGDVRLATPVVNHSASAAPDSSDAELNVGSQVAPNADSLSSLTGGHSKEPAAPAPVGGDVKQARLVKSVPPVYPSMARSQHISGNVTLDALIDAQGNVTTMKVLSGSPVLHQAALEAVKQWKYSPAQLDGSPTAMHLTVTVQFRIQ